MGVFVFVLSVCARLSAARQIRANLCPTHHRILFALPMVPRRSRAVEMWMDGMRSGGAAGTDGRGWCASLFKCKTYKFIMTMIPFVSSFYLYRLFAPLYIVYLSYFPDTANTPPSLSNRSRLILYAYISEQLLLEHAHSESRSVTQKANGMFGALLKPTYRYPNTPT